MSEPESVGSRRGGARWKTKHELKNARQVDYMALFERVLSQKFIDEKMG